MMHQFTPQIVKAVTNLVALYRNIKNQHFCTHSHLFNSIVRSCCSVDLVLLENSLKHNRMSSIFTGGSEFVADTP